MILYSIFYSVLRLHCIYNSPYLYKKNLSFPQKKVLLIKISFQIKKYRHFDYNYPVTFFQFYFIFYSIAKKKDNPIKKTKYTQSRLVSFSSPPIPRSRINWSHSVVASSTMTAPSSIFDRRSCITRLTEEK